MGYKAAKAIGRALVTLSFLLGTLRPAQAQSSALTNQQVTSKQVTSQQVTPEQIERLVRSLLSIQPLVDSADRELLAAGSVEEQQAIERQFVRSASEIVVGEGLSVELYGQLIHLANADPEFRGRVSTQLDLVQSEQPPLLPQ